MKKKKFMRAISLALAIYTVCASGHITAAANADMEAADTADFADVNGGCVTALSDNVIVGSRLRELFFGKDTNEDKCVYLVPGGEVFGAKIKQKNVTVTDSRGIPALKCGDIILSVNGERVETAADVKRIVESSHGESVTIRALHAGSEVGVEVRPTYENGAYRLGLSLRDGAAGIGTVTFIDPETGLFGGLGHGICDSDTGEIISMENGDICGVILGGVHRGECGKPGELCGILTDEDVGDLTLNNECGVFGIVTGVSAPSDEALPIAKRDEVCEGEAKIISTIKNGKTAEYKIEIFDIDRDSTGSKSFRIRVTDETLKALTGGIVRGMSGSPIIQNGKLVGAVTHVMVADPTEGYGIFIENMLNAAEGQAQPKAA